MISAASREQILRQINRDVARTVENLLNQPEDKETCLQKYIDESQQTVEDFFAQEPKISLGHAPDVQMHTIGKVDHVQNKRGPLIRTYSEQTGEIVERVQLRGRRKLKRTMKQLGAWGRIVGSYWITPITPVRCIRAEFTLDKEL